MPGLFGVLRMSAQSASPSDLRATFERMARVLGTAEGEMVEPRIELDDLLIGRSGPPHLHHTPWPGSSDPPASARTFVAGVLHPDRADAHTESPGPLSVDQLSALRGFFCLAHHDASSGRFLLMADRRGSFPIYYAQVGGHLLFAPEVRALLAHPELRPHLDLGAAATLISCGHLMGDQTLLSSVRRVRGGEVFLVEGGMANRRAYWRFAPGSLSGGHSDLDLEEELSRLVRASARRHLGDPAKTIIFLSGGADSRGILGAALDAVGGDGSQLNTVSWGVSEGEPNTDVSIARQIASSMNLRHQFVPRRTYEYGSHFAQANALIGSASDIAAYHPLEYSMMRDLRGAGFERALRGDEAFGWLNPVRTIADALKKVKLYRVADFKNLGGIIRVEHHDEWSNASDSVFLTATEEVRGSDPNDAKDYLYFTHRLQGYLNTASYYKLCMLDQRNVLLDDEILDFLEFVPARLRADKVLYRRSMGRAFPQLWQVPFAATSNLEHWGEVLANSRPVRRFIEQSLDDKRSQIWEFFDRDALVGLFVSTSAQALRSSPRNRARSLVRTILRQFPEPVSSRARGWRAARVPLRLPAHAILFRVMVLKQFVDELAPTPRS